jgi:PAS domain S-box-containing protein
MDKDGNFEWVNPGFTRMYGYTLQLLKNELGSNIKEISANPKISEYIDYCIKNKTTVTYEARNITRDGRVIWVQTSLTPILNENDEVEKLFAIETDITKLKEQEREIRQINEELRRQRDTLQEQKEQIELQNKLIKDSIRYAQTIQSAILPPLSLLKKYFDVFIIYKPRDIVSGDFYWFAKTGEHQYFLAVVDCTGHGVPGSFMSLIASRMLSEIIIEKGLRSPKKYSIHLTKPLFQL